MVGPGALGDGGPAGKGAARRDVVILYVNGASQGQGLKIWERARYLWGIQEIPNTLLSILPHHPFHLHNNSKRYHFIPILEEGIEYRTWPHSLQILPENSTFCSVKL